MCLCQRKEAYFQGEIANPLGLDFFHTIAMIHAPTDVFNGLCNAFCNNFVAEEMYSEKGKCKRNPFVPRSRVEK